MYAAPIAYLNSSASAKKAVDLFHSLIIPSGHLELFKYYAWEEDEKKLR
jgi:hypothetical protein